MDGHGWARMNCHFLSFVPPWRRQIAGTGVWQRCKGAEQPFLTHKQPQNSTKLTLFYRFLPVSKTSGNGKSPMFKREMAFLNWVRLVIFVFLKQGRLATEAQRHRGVPIPLRNLRVLRATPSPRQLGPASRWLGPGADHRLTLGT